MHISHGFRANIGAGADPATGSAQQCLAEGRGGRQAAPSRSTRFVLRSMSQSARSRRRRSSSVRSRDNCSTTQPPDFPSPSQNGQGGPGQASLRPTGPHEAAPWSPPAGATAPAASISSARRHAGDPCEGGRREQLGDAPGVDRSAEHDLAVIDGDRDVVDRLPERALDDVLADFRRDLAVRPGERAEDEIGPRDDSDQLAVVHDRQAVDTVLAHQLRRTGDRAEPLDRHRRARHRVGGGAGGKPRLVLRIAVAEEAGEAALLEQWSALLLGDDVRLGVRRRAARRPRRPERPRSRCWRGCPPPRAAGCPGPPRSRPSSSTGRHPCRPPFVGPHRTARRRRRHRCAPHCARGFSPSATPLGNEQRSTTRGKAAPRFRAGADDRARADRHGPGTATRRTRRNRTDRSAAGGAGQGLPRGASRGDTLVFAVRYAVQAPSARNSQPWIFRPAGERLELWADRERALPVVDPDGRELTISCGAALHHFRVALRHLGFDARVEPFPTSACPTCWRACRSRRWGRRRTTTTSSIWPRRRRTSRQRYLDSPVPPDLVEQLVEAGASEGASVAVTSAEPERAALAALVAEADRRQADDPAFVRELAACIHRNRSRAPEGMPASTLGIPSGARERFRWMHAASSRLKAGSSACRRSASATSAASAALGSAEVTATEALDAGLDELLDEVGWNRAVQVALPARPAAIARRGGCSHTTAAPPRSTRARAGRASAPSRATVHAPSKVMDAAPQLMSTRSYWSTTGQARSQSSRRSPWGERSRGWRAPRRSRTANTSVSPYGSSLAGSTGRAVGRFGSMWLCRTGRCCASAVVAAPRGAAFPVVEERFRGESR